MGSSFIQIYEPRTVLEGNLHRASRSARTVAGEREIQQATQPSEKPGEEVPGRSVYGEQRGSLESYPDEMEQAQGEDVLLALNEELPEEAEGKERNVQEDEEEEEAPESPLQQLRERGWEFLSEDNIEVELVEEERIERTLLEAIRREVAEVCQIARLHSGAIDNTDITLEQLMRAFFPITITNLMAREIKGTLSSRG